MGHRPTSFIAGPGHISSHREELRHLPHTPKQFGIETPNCRFCGTHAPVLDCAHGKQEENQEEGDEIEANWREENGAVEGAGKEENSSQEVGEDKAPEKG